MKGFLAPLLSVCLLVSGCASGGSRRALADWGRAGSRYMVAADHPLASKAGARMLAKGGNVVDAAVATSFALAVTRPYSAGLGGGGFMLIHRLGKEPVVLDYRETAPRAAGLENYVDADGNVLAGKTVRGHWAVGVPGHVKGLAHALKHYGTKSLAEALEPAIRLAWEGFPVDRHTHEAMVKLAAWFEKNGPEKQKYSEIYRIFLKDGKPYAVGELFRQEDLSKSLREIADGGEKVFYEGVIARRIVDEMQTQLGPMTAEDLKSYRVIARAPLKGKFRGYDVVSMPPPSSGGACLIEILNVMEGYDPQTTPPADYYHALAEAMKHAFADRAAYLGDADFHPEAAQDAARMISRERAREVRAAILPDKTRAPAEYGSRRLGDDGGTTHYGVMDAEGNAVAATETINLSFGSYVMPRGTGIVLNNELDDFSVKTETPNEFGLMMSERNLLKPLQRPLSSMSPTLLLKDGKAVLAAGASGGPKIITATLQAVLQNAAFGLPPDRAVAAPRIHHQWSPDVLRFEEGLGPGLKAALEAKGHQIELYAGSEAGVCQVVSRSDGRLVGASDPRKGGRPYGR